MKKTNRYAFGFIFLLVLSSLACNFSAQLPWNVGPEDVEISPEDIAVAATRAAEAAAAAAVAANQAGELAATAVTQGDSAVATAVNQGGDDSAATGGSLQQKMANIQPDANGNFTVDVTESDLNEFIAGQGGAFQTETLSAEKIQIKISPENLVLTGDVNEPVDLPLEVKLRPVVSNGQVRFELISATAGIFPVPDSMLDLIEAGANSELSRAIAGLPNGVTLQDVTLANGVFTILGHQN